MNRRSKGLRSQRKVKEFLLSNGYDLVYVISHTRWKKDIFSLWDGFCIKNGEVIFFQVKTNSKPNMKLYREWYKKYRVAYFIAVVYDRKKEVELFW